MLQRPGRTRSCQAPAAPDTSAPLQQYDDGHGDRHYGHCVVAGIDQYPLKISKSMEKKKLDKRSKLKPFLKVVNYNHVMPTRCATSVGLLLPSGALPARPQSRALQLSRSRERGGGRGGRGRALGLRESGRGPVARESWSD